MEVDIQQAHHQVQFFKAERCIQLTYHHSCCYLRQKEKLANSCKFNLSPCFMRCLLPALGFASSIKKASTSKRVIEFWSWRSGGWEIGDRVDFFYCYFQEEVWTFGLSHCTCIIQFKLGPPNYSFAALRSMLWSIQQLLLFFFRWTKWHFIIVMQTLSFSYMAMTHRQVQKVWNLCQGSKLFPPYKHSCPFLWILSFLF